MAKRDELLKVAAKFDGILYCKECGKAIGYTLLKAEVPVMCIRCMKKCMEPFDTHLETIIKEDAERADMKKHFANNPGVLKLLKEQEDHNRMKGGE